MPIQPELIEQLFTLRDYWRWGASRFQEAGLYYGHGTDNAYDEALALILHALHLPHARIEDILDARLTLAERERVVALLARRRDERLPLPYLTGEAWFAGLSFAVDRRVLIPRSPVAELIEAGFEPWCAGTPPARILDLCAGSGCIGIACALYLEDSEVTLADIDADALDVAQANIQRHAVAGRVRAVRSDLFAELAGERFDLIISNPPYVDAADMAALPPEYRHEPALALAAGEDGLDLVRRMLREAADHLNEGGLLIVEVGNSWEALEEVYPTLPLTWLEFERGGHGVFLLTREQLVEHAAEL